MFGKGYYCPQCSVRLKQWDLENWLNLTCAQHQRGCISRVSKTREPFQTLWMCGVRLWGFGFRVDIGSVCGFTGSRRRFVPNSLSSKTNISFVLEPFQTNTPLQLGGSWTLRCIGAILGLYTITETQMEKNMENTMETRENTGVM